VHSGLNYNQGMHEQDHLAVLFADVSQSTRLYEVMDDNTARAMVSRCPSVLGAITEWHRGQVVKTNGVRRRGIGSQS